MRTCPRCRTALAIVGVGGVEIDRCASCGGAFFEPGEAAAMLGPEADPSAWASGAAMRAPTPDSAYCPSGHGPMWAYDVFRGSDGVTVHACGGCRGMWLDRKSGRALVKLVREGRDAESFALAESQVGVGSYLFMLFTGMPMEVWNPVKQRPYIVWTLAAVLSLIYSVQFQLSRTSPAVANDIVRGYGVVSHHLLAGNGLLTVFSHAFLHGGWQHLIGNLYFLWIFGDNIEDRLGRLRFTAVYLLAMVGGALAFAVTEHGSLRPMIGASGAISGLMGAYIVLFPKVRLWVVFFFKRFHISAYWYLGFWAALQVVMQAMGVPGVAFTAHLGGLGVGILAALALRPRVAADTVDIERE